MEELEFLHIFLDTIVYDRHCVLDTIKIHEETGWSSWSGFEDKLENTVDWYLDNPEWVKNVVTGKYK